MPAEKLDYLSLIEINGDDALSFLQGQLTNDINQTSSTWQYSGYCNPKGRLLALFQIWSVNNKIHLIIDSSLVDSITKRLRMYVMRSKVTITVINSDFYAAADADTLSELANALPEADLNTLTSNKNAIVSTNEMHILSYEKRFLFITQNQTNSTVNRDHTTSTITSSWAQLNINDGLPHINAMNTELFIPQMLNLDALDAINFKKGCYTGQEIIARMHYLGKLKQRMFVCDLSTQGNSNINPGDKVYSDPELSRSVGHIANSNNSSALAVLRLDALDENTHQPLDQLHLSAQTTLNIRQQQPYSLPAPKSK